MTMEITMTAMRDARIPPTIGPKFPDELAVVYKTQDIRIRLFFCVHVSRSSSIREELGKFHF